MKPSPRKDGGFCVVRDRRRRAVAAIVARRGPAAGRQGAAGKRSAEAARGQGQRAGAQDRRRREPRRLSPPPMASPVQQAADSSVPTAPGLPPAAVQQIFGAPVGAAGVALADNGGRLVFKVHRRHDAAARRERPGDGRACRRSSTPASADDLFSQYVSGLQTQLGVQVNQTALRSRSAGRNEKGRSMFHARIRRLRRALRGGRAVAGQPAAGRRSRNPGLRLHEAVARPRGRRLPARIGRRRRGARAAIR